MRLVLASASPRRRALLAQVGVPCEVAPSEVDEAPGPGEAPAALALRLAEAKAAAVARRMAPPVRAVLGADTVVAVEGESLGKPADAAEAEAMILRLSGRWHEVVTGVALVAPGGRLLERFACTTRVRFRAAARDEAARYAAQGEGLDKAGGYAIQGVGGALVEAIDGSYSNVVGLPLAETVVALRRHGVIEAWP